MVGGFQGFEFVVGRRVLLQTAAEGQGLRQTAWTVLDGSHLD